MVHLIRKNLLPSTCKHQSNALFGFIKDHFTGSLNMNNPIEGIFHGHNEANDQF